MIHISLGKALVPIERNGKYRCADCVLYRKGCDAPILRCVKQERGDKKDVIFKLVDYPAKGEK